MEFDEYYKEVLQKALAFGYTKEMVDCFKFDIAYHYENGLTVDECIKIEF